jgi:tetratricopeptide (TPR) repeat protein
MLGGGMSEAVRRRAVRGVRAISAGQWVLGLAVAASALAVGSVHTATLCVVTAALAAAVVLEWWSAEPMRVRSVATVLLVTGVALVVYTAVQCIPLPAGWLAAVAPYNAGVWSRALAPLGEPGPRYAPITLDPAGTRVELLKGVAYLLAFAAGLRVARRREGVEFLSAVVIATGVTLALAALLHPAFGAHRLFGVYEPSSGAGDRHLAPLLNPNNLAGYINIAFCLCFAEVLAPEPLLARPIMGTVALLLVGTQLWIASRGGVLTMGVGAFVVMVVHLVRAKHERAAATLSWTTAGAAVIGATLVVLTSFDEASNELFDPSADKLRFFFEALRMVPAMPLFGCGRGAFESTFPAFRTNVGHVTFTHPENVIAQWLVEWGVPVGAAGLLAVAAALRPHAVLARSTTAAGAWAALIALTVQNLVDLGSEVPGLMLAAVACTSIVVGGTRGDDARWRVLRWAGAPRRVAACAAIAAALAIALASTSMPRELGVDRSRLHEAALGHPVPVGEMHAIARGAMLRHPGEPYLPFITGLGAVHARDDNPLPWLGATIERARVYAPAHLVLARVLARRAAAQARLEYRLAFEQAPELIGMVLAEAPRTVGGFYDAMELVPAGPRGVPMLDGLASALAERLPAARVQLDAELMARAPENQDAAVRVAHDAADDLYAGEAAPWCDGPGRAACLREALTKALRVQRLLPDRCVGYDLHARARATSGDTRGAVEELEGAVDVVGDRAECLQKLVSLARGLGNEARAQAALERLVSSGCSTDAECAQQLNWVASQQEAVGNVTKALALCQRAHQRAPDDDGVTEHMASLAARAGLHAEAAESYDVLTRRRPDDPRWRKAAEHERGEVLKGALKL